MILVMRAICSAMMPAFFSTASRIARLLLDRARARPPMTFSGVPTSCAISAAIWPIVASFSVWPSRCSSASLASLALPLRRAPRAATGHGVEARRDRADLVVALARGYVRQVALATASMPRSSLVIGRLTKRVASAADDTW